MATQGKIYVYKRKSKKGFSWTYRIEAGKDPATGKRRCVTGSGFKTAKEARAAAQPRLNKLLLGQNIIDSKILFSDYAARWLEEYSVNRKWNTIKTFKWGISVFNDYLKNKQLNNITTYDCQIFINKFSQNHSKQTLIKLIFLLKRIFKHAIKYNHININPINNIEYPPCKKNIKRVEDLYLTKSELKEFLLFAKEYSYHIGHNSTYFYYMMYTMAFTGIRVGEACALLWRDIDFDNKLISIKSNMVGNSFKNSMRQDTPKTKNSIRTIYMDNTLLDILKQWRKIQLSLRIFNGTQNKRADLDYVFTKYSPGKNLEYPLIPANIISIFVTINRKNISRKHLHSHILRHTHASLLAEAGITLEVIQDRLGHKNDKTTTMIYLHVTENMKKSSIDIFEKYMQC